MRKFTYTIAAAVIFLTAACSQTEKTEAVTAEITAAQMEGRSAARAIISRKWTDTTGLSRRVRMAKAERLKYDTTGRAECAAAFDTAFIRTVRTVNPTLAKSIHD